MAHSHALQSTKSSIAHSWPIRYVYTIPLALLAIALALRIIDIFVLRLDERLGEIILSKSLGFLLVAGYVGATTRSLVSIGLHRRHFWLAVFIGGIGTGLYFLVGYGLQLASLAAQGQAPQLVFTAIDPKTGLAGGAGFAVFLVVGNVVNSFMEEGLFRGLMLGRFRLRLSFWCSLLLQAGLFALWHLVWPVKHYLFGTAGAGAALGEASMLLIGTFISGLVYGYLYLKTGSLWAPWAAHTLNNTVLNLVHIRTIQGLDTDMMVVQIGMVMGLVGLMFWTRWIVGQAMVVSRSRPSA